MKKYTIFITPQAHKSLENITLYKIEYDKNHALIFLDNFYKEVNKLEILPNIGFNISNKLKAKNYLSYIIVYRVNEIIMRVEVIDIIDPRQYIIAKRYY